MLKKDAERFEGQAERLFIERREVEEKAKEVASMTLRVHEESEVVCNVKNALDTQRQEVEHARFELESERAFIKAERLKLDELKTDLASR